MRNKEARDAASRICVASPRLKQPPPPTVSESATKRSPFNPRALTTSTSDDLAIRKIGPHYEIIVIPLRSRWGTGGYRGENGGRERAGEPSGCPGRQAFFSVKIWKTFRVAPVDDLQKRIMGLEGQSWAPLNHVQQRSRRGQCTQKNPLSEQTTYIASGH